MAGGDVVISVSQLAVSEAELPGQGSSSWHQQDLMRALGRLPPNCRVVAVCDCCGAGTMLDLPHKLKARPSDGALTVVAPPPGAPPPALRAPAALLSCCRDGATAPDAAGSGVLARSVAAAIARPGGEPPAAALLEELRQMLAAHAGPGCQSPMVSCSAPFDPASFPLGFLPPRPAGTPTAHSPVAGRTVRAGTARRPTQHQPARMHVIQLRSADESLGLSSVMAAGGAGPLIVSEADGAASRAGVRPLSVIRSFAGRAVADQHELHAAVEAWRRTYSLRAEL
eukprot:gene2007-66931_t